MKFFICLFYVFSSLYHYLLLDKKLYATYSFDKCALTKKEILALSKEGWSMYFLSYPDTTTLRLCVAMQYKSGWLIGAQIRWKRQTSSEDLHPGPLWSFVDSAWSFSFLLNVIYDLNIHVLHKKVFCRKRESTNH